MRYKGQRFYMRDNEGVSHETLQVSKATAKKVYDRGKTVWLQSCNMRVSNSWQIPMPVNKARIGGDPRLSDCTFDDIVNYFRYGNCDRERGQYAVFFAPVD